MVENNCLFYKVKKKKMKGKIIYKDMKFWEMRTEKSMGKKMQNLGSKTCEALIVLPRVFKLDHYLSICEIYNLKMSEMPQLEKN